MTRLSDGVCWLGAVDWDAREFHGYVTELGTTYNAYLIQDEKTALVDSVKAPFAGRLLADLRARLGDLARLDYLVCNHAEPDHSGAMPTIMEACPNATVVCTAKGAEILRGQYGERGWRFQTVGAGDTLPLGKRSLQFLPVPMVHWPDSMMSWCPEDKILFSNDAFGQHYATSHRFDDEVPFAELMKQAAKYYANIVMPFGAQVKKALAAAAGLDIRAIAPSHGLVWRARIAEIAAKYAAWSGNETERRAVVVYDTMWNATRQLARAITDGFIDAGVPVMPIDVKNRELSDIMLDLLEARYICVGSPTLNNGCMPTIAAFLNYLRGLAPKNRAGLAFGSYGWGGQSVGQVAEQLAAIGITELLAPVKTPYTPTPEALETLRKAVCDAVKA